MAWKAALLLTVLVLAGLALAPTGDTSYTCEDPPIVRLINPEAERSQEHFFDAGTHCNADARRRGRLMLIAGGAGLLLAATVGSLGGLSTRREGTP